MDLPTGEQMRQANELFKNDGEKKADIEAAAEQFKSSIDKTAKDIGNRTVEVIMRNGSSQQKQSQAIRDLLNRGRIAPSSQAGEFLAAAGLIDWKNFAVTQKGEELLRSFGYSLKDDIKAHKS